MTTEIMYGVEFLVAFRHDPFMLHQTNAVHFLYDDPVAGYTHNTSLVALFVTRVVNSMMQLFSLPSKYPFLPPSPFSLPPPFLVETKTNVLLQSTNHKWMTSSQCSNKDKPWIHAASQRPSESTTPDKSCKSPRRAHRRVPSRSAASRYPVPPS
jgi:hypothetical protein